MVFVGFARVQQSASADASSCEPTDGLQILPVLDEADGPHRQRRALRRYAYSDSTNKVKETTMSYGQLLDSDLYCYAEERDANGSLIGYGWKLRTKEETDSIRQQRITQQEDVVLAAAEMIRMRRKHESKDTSEDTDTMQTLTNALGLSREAYYALKEARIGLRMWGMATKKIDDIIGPMTEQERDKAREARGAPLPDDNDPPDEMVDIKTKMKVFFYDGYVRPTVGSKHPVEVILLISEENIASAATRAKQHALENHYTFPDGYQLKITEFDTSKPFITTIKK